MFLPQFLLSLFAALGLAKCLKNGMANPIAPGGPLDGLLSGKFLVAMLASALVLVLRGTCIAFTIIPGGQDGGQINRFLFILLHSYRRKGVLPSYLPITVTILLMFLPQFLLSLFATLNFRDKSSLKILYRHPFLIILPTVTFFTFSKISHSNGDTRLTFRQGVISFASVKIFSNDVCKGPEDGKNT